MSVSQRSLSGTPPSAANRPQLDVLHDPARLAAVDRILSAGPPTRVLHRLTVVAAQLLDTPSAQVSLLSAEGQVVAALVGAAAEPSAQRTPVEDSLCSVTAAHRGPLVVEDAAGHPWVYDLPPVTSGQVCAYLGVVLTDAAGHVLGSVCVYGGTPRRWSDEDITALTVLAEAVATELEADLDA
jgi:GAF domain-containing protein